MTGAPETLSSDEVRKILEGVEDPEIPVVNVVELGIIKGIKVDGKSVSVEVTPTYSGCPAVKHICDEIEKTLREHGFDSIDIQEVYSPAWTTDCLTPETKAKLKDYGIAAPKKTSDLVQINGVYMAGNILCPFCDSAETEVRSEFGRTACKSFYFCKACCQPFEYFKAI